MKSTILKQYHDLFRVCADPQPYDVKYLGWLWSHNLWTSVTITIAIATQSLLILFMSVYCCTLAEEGPWVVASYNGGWADICSISHIQTQKSAQV